MKILFFINGIHPGGKERRMLELMKELKFRKEIEFELVLMNREVSYPEIFAMSVPLHFLIRKTKKDFSVFRKFYKICKEFKPDIIHCWDSMTAVYAIPACKLLKIKLMNGMVVDTPVKQNILNKNWLRAKLTFPFSNIIIGNSKAGLSAYGAPLNKSLCIYNGMNLSRFVHLPEPQLIKEEIFGDDSNDLIVVGMVAAFEIRKDYKTIIKAALNLCSTIDNIRFLFIGEGELLNEMKKLVTANYEKKIIFSGKKSNVETYINIFDIGVLLTNSKVHGEGISNSIIEYMALKKPVIATAGGGTDEVVFDNVNGFIIEPNNEIQLENKIKDLIGNKNRESLGLKGYEMVAEIFDIKRMTSIYSEVYHKLIQKKKNNKNISKISGKNYGIIHA